MKYTLTLSLAFLCLCSTHAQIKTVATSSTSIGSLISGYSNVTTINTVTVNYTPSAAPTYPTPVDEDSTTEDPWLYPYADVLSVNYTMTNGNITSTPAGKVWTLRISVTNALNVGFVFSQFNLSSTAQLYIFNESRNMLKGPIKKSQFTVSSKVGIAPLNGDKVIIYILEPNNFGTFQSVVAVNTVEAGYQPVGKVGSLGITTLDVDCIPTVMCGGNMIAARSVAMIFTNGYQGTGTLINNQNNNGRPLLLTAFHLLDVNKVLGIPVGNGFLDASEISALSQARFLFGYWRTACNGSTNAPYIEFDGATVVAQWKNSDMVLLELNNAPGVGDGVNYAGWNRQSGAPDDANSYIIHHPAGADMRVTKTKKVNSWLWNSNFWTAHYSSGVVKGGSSGAALFNPVGQIVGQLRGGWSGCAFTDFGDRYGKFERSWSGGLQAVLSPAGSTSMTSLILSPLSISGPSTVPCGSSGNTFSVPGLLGCTYTWTVSANLTISSGQNTPTITVVAGNPAGAVTGQINVTINDSKGYTRVLAAAKTVNLGAPPTPTIQILGIAPLPNTQMDVSVTTIAPAPYKWYVDNVLVRTASTVTTTINGGGCGQHTLKVEVANNCGVSSNSTSYSRQCSFASVAPNPASTFVQVRIVDDNDLATKSTSGAHHFTQIEVYNRNGDHLSSLRYPAGTLQASISVSSWPEDTYVIRVLTEDGWEEHKIIITR